MDKFLVEYKTNEPVWGDITLEAEDAQHAEKNALEILELRHPNTVIDIETVQPVNVD